MITTYDVFVPPTMGYGASKRIGIDLAKGGHKKAFMVYDKGMWDFGIAQPIIENLKAAGMEVVTFDKVLPDPPDEMVEEAADKGLPYINYQTLHRQIWQKQYFRALAQHEPTKFSGDYTQVPRGRVAWAVDHFVVFVGQWAKDIEDELTELLEKYFALPYFEFKYDDHWDLGHGWSGDL